MSDPRLPLKINPVPGGFAVAFARGGQHIYIYGREPRVASAAGTLTLDEAKTRVQEIARALTTAWDGGAKRPQPYGTAPQREAAGPTYFRRLPK